MSTKTINLTIEDLIERFKKYNDNAEDIDLIKRAYQYAEKNISGKRGYQEMIISYTH